MSLGLSPDVSHNFLGMVLCFDHMEDMYFQRAVYSVKTTTSDFAWSDGRYFSFYTEDEEEEFDHCSCMHIVPKSIFSLSDDDDEIEFTAAPVIFYFKFGDLEDCERTETARILGIHLLYKSDLQ